MSGASKALGGGLPLVFQSNKRCALKRFRYLPDRSGVLAFTGKLALSKPVRRYFDQANHAVLADRADGPITAAIKQDGLICSASPGAAAELAPAAQSCHVTQITTLSRGVEQWQSSRRTKKTQTSKSPQLARRQTPQPARPGCRPPSASPRRRRLGRPRPDL